jgi:hypothetical protein
MWLDLPIYAVQRSASGRWLIQVPSGNPFEPAVFVVDAIDEPQLRSHHDSNGKERQEARWSFGGVFSQWRDLRGFEDTVRDNRQPQARYFLQLPPFR